MADSDDAPLVIGVDVATENVRALCCDAYGAVRAAAQCPLSAVRRVGPGESEQDARSWWPAVLACLQEVAAELGRAARGVRAISVCATSGTVVLVDRGGAPVGPALMYDDRRGAQFAVAADTAGRARWGALGVRHGPTSTTGRIAWLLRHASRTSTLVCHTPDLVTWRLVGRRTPSDWSHALKSGFDPLRGEWAGEAYAALRIPLDRLPEVLAPATEVGTVDPEIAAAAGLPASCAVRLGMTDGCAAQIACGTVEPGTAVTVLGTTLVVKAASRDLVVDPTGAVYSHRGPDGTWFPGGASNTGGEALTAYTADTAEELADLDDAAERRGESSVVRYPLRREGERFPFVAPEARGFTLGTPADRVDAYRAELEGVALIERLGYEHLRRLGVTFGDGIRTAGGGSRSTLWTRIRASALRRSLRRVRRGDTAFGAAVLAATGGLHPDLRSAVHAMVGHDDVIEPYPAWSGRLDERYHRLHAELERRGYLATPVPATP